MYYTKGCEATVVWCSLVTKSSSHQSNQDSDTPDSRANNSCKEWGGIRRAYKYMQKNDTCSAHLLGNDFKRNGISNYKAATMNHVTNQPAVFRATRSTLAPQAFDFNEQNLEISAHQVAG